MRSSVSATAAAALLLVAHNLVISPADAQSLQMPSDAELKAQMAKQRQETNAVLQQHIAPVKPGTFKAEVPAIKAPPPARTQSLDEVVKQFNEAKKGPKVTRGASDLIIFVSFSMPKDILKELSRQAKATGAVMVIRGFKNGSMKETKQAALEVNRAGAPWEIHPDLFKAFKVKSVPTFVVARAEAQSVLDDGCSPEATFSSVSGNISVELALDTIRRRAQPVIAKMAESRLAAIRAKNQPGSIQ